MSHPQRLEVCVEDRQGDGSTRSKASSHWQVNLLLCAPAVRENVMSSQVYVQEPHLSLRVASGWHRWGGAYGHMSSAHGIATPGSVTGAVQPESPGALKG